MGSSVLGASWRPSEQKGEQRWFDGTYSNRRLDSGLSSGSGLGGDSLDGLGLLDGSNGGSGVRHYEDLGGS